MGVSELFWPISRALLISEQKNVREVHRLRSLVTYQILFGGRLVIRDSDYLNSLALRSSVIRTLEGTADDHATFFRTLLDEDFIIIARRKERSLREVAQQLGEKGGSQIVPYEWYLPSATDIAYLESSRTMESSAVQFSLSDASSYYTRQLQKMLSESLEPYMDEQFRLRVAERVAVHVAEHGSVGWEFLSPNGGVWEPFSEDERKKHENFLYYTLGQAPHTGFIPDMLGINPIYMHDVAKAIDIWRGRHLRDRRLVEQRTMHLGSGFSFSDYIDYLSLLPFDALVKLVSGDEGTSFRQACELFSFQRLSLREVEDAYRSYRKAIDSELLRYRHALPQSGGKADLRAFIQSAKENAVDEGVDIVCDEVLGSVVPFWRLGLSVFYRVTKGEWPNERKIRLARESTVRNIATEVSRLQDEGEKLKASLIVDIRGAEDRVVYSESSDGDICVADPSITS